MKAKLLKLDSTKNVINEILAAFYSKGLKVIAGGNKGAD